MNRVSLLWWHTKWACLIVTRSSSAKQITKTPWLYYERGNQSQVLAPLFRQGASDLIPVWGWSPSLLRPLKSEKLKPKITAKKPPTTWRYTRGKTRFLGKSLTQRVLFQILALWTVQVSLQRWSATNLTSWHLLKKCQEPGRLQGLVVIETSNIYEPGRLHYFAWEWHKITNDPLILDIVKHCHIDINVEDIEHLFLGVRISNE